MNIRQYISLVENASNPYTKLLKHHAIGWDFDLTLFGSPASPSFHQFINDHPEIQHYIVTFRTHGLVHQIFSDLACYDNAPPESAFSSVLNISIKGWAEHDRAERLRMIGKLTGPPTEAELYYWDWKGQTCKQHGLTALVDDKAEHTEDGCNKAGVEFFNTAWFIPS